jgi:phosphoribosylanthranilate isomerase
MSLKTKVKAGNITNLSDARYCAGMGVDWLGFPIDVVSPATFKEITDWVTGPEFVLELSETTPIGSFGQYPVTTLQISSGRLDMIDLLPSVKWMVKLSLSDWGTQKSKLLRFKEKINQLVLDLDSKDFQVLKDIASNFRILVNQHDTLSLADLLTLPVEGINLSGENELKPGLKDFEKLASILEELEIAE